MAEAHQTLTDNQVWEKSLNDIKHLYQYRTLRYSQWMSVYTYIFDYCTKDRQPSGAELYQRFEDYLVDHVATVCQSLAGLQDEYVLEDYLEQWRKYCHSSKILHGICSYLHRHYITRERSGGNRNIKDIYALSLQSWRRGVAQQLYNRITQVCLAMIRAERNHQTIDTEIIRTVIQTYNADRCIDTSNNDEQMLDVYQECFEQQFLHDTGEFYRLEAFAYLREHPVHDYILEIPQYIDREVSRVASYLHPSSFKKLDKKLKEIFIRDQLMIIYAEAKILIREEKMSELHRLYQTVIQVVDGKIELMNLMEDHIHQMGLEAIERIDLIEIHDLDNYTQTIDDLHGKYTKFITSAFEFDRDFQSVLDRACRKLTNDNAVIKTIGTMTKFAEYLARYCDKLLRKGSQRSDLGLIFKQIKTVLYYMQEKDVFKKFYSNFLAKRLVNQLSISHEYEMLMVENIQEAYGFEHTTKLKQMCLDIITSGNVLQQYQQHCLTQDYATRMRFHVLILNSNAWFFSRPPTVVLPTVLKNVLDHFSKYYYSIHSQRKLVWAYQYSTSELHTFFINREYTLQVSMYQMLVLLLFNESLEWTVERIQDRTQIKTDLLLQVLNTLLHSKLLTCTQAIDEQNLNARCTLNLSNNFTSEKIRVNLHAPIESNQQKDALQLYTKIDRDRDMTIQAAIVRIMKAHQTHKYSLLVQEVIEQLSSHFDPDVSTIKKCVDNLIEKEYLRWKSNATDAVEYVA